MKKETVIKPKTKKKENQNIPKRNPIEKGKNEENSVNLSGDDEQRQPKEESEMKETTNQKFEVKKKLNSKKSKRKKSITNTDEDHLSKKKKAMDEDEDEDVDFIMKKIEMLQNLLKKKKKKVINIWKTYLKMIQKIQGRWKNQTLNQKMKRMKN